MGEFELIELLTRSLREFETAPNRALPVGPGDDAAVLFVPADRQAVVTVDTLVEGVHFFRDTPADDLGHKCLAVNLSDLAAMGAEPGWYFLALTLPDIDLKWLADFARGMGTLAGSSGIQLGGGDTTRGPRSITVTAVGTIPRGQALLRSGANAGDAVVVSGTLGLAALGLEQLRTGTTPAEAARAALQRPEARLALGTALRGRATACIDVSDGLAADLSHILAASGVGAEVSLSELPLAPPVRCLPPEAAWVHALTGGDDYELCFTLPQYLIVDLPAMAASARIPLSVIGRITVEPGLQCRRPDGSLFQPGAAGFDHFRNRDL